MYKAADKGSEAVVIMFQKAGNQVTNSLKVSFFARKRLLPTFGGIISGPLFQRNLETGKHYKKTVQCECFLKNIKDFAG